MSKAPYDDAAMRSCLATNSVSSFGVSSAGVGDGGTGDGGCCCTSGWLSVAMTAELAVSFASSSAGSPAEASVVVCDVTDLLACVVFVFMDAVVSLDMTSFGGGGDGVCAVSIELLFSKL